MNVFTPWFKNQGTGCPIPWALHDEYEVLWSTGTVSPGDHKNLWDEAHECYYPGGPTALIWRWALLGEIFIKAFRVRQDKAHLLPDGLEMMEVAS